MTLEDYLCKNGLKPHEFALRIDTSREAVRRYVSGERLPRPDIMARIVAATGGAVTDSEILRAYMEKRPRQAESAA